MCKPIKAEETQLVDRSKPVACNIRMTRDFEVSGGSFSRLTWANNQSLIDLSTGLITFNLKGRAHGMSVHSALIGTWELV